MSRSMLFVTLLTGLCLAPAAEAGKKDKKKKKGPAETGWVQKSEAWAGKCWFPPDFEAMGSGDRRMSWQTTRDAIMRQWNGSEGDGVSMTEKHVINMETVLLAKPERIESVAAQNLEHCRAYMDGKETIDQWEAWLIATPGKLTVGECPYAPLDYTLFDYLNINEEWQIPAYVCKDDHIKVKGTEGDYFKLDKAGEWINVSGDPEQPTAGGFQCNVEGCFKGQLIMKFTGDSGVTSVHPIGTYAEFLVPEHGKIQVMINDDTLTDNFWKVDSGLEHHTGIEYSPKSK